MTRILLVDDHPLLRQGIAMTIEAEAEQVAEEAPKRGRRSRRASSASVAAETDEVAMTPAQRGDASTGLLERAMRRGAQVVTANKQLIAQQGEELHALAAECGVGLDYEAAVMTGGHIGFGLGITPNAVANMEALTERFGPAPRSFLIVPVVGAFFIDFSNPLIITAFANLVR